MNALQSHDERIFRNCSKLIGIDEAGRGALAGPVVAGACLLKEDFFRSEECVGLSSGINDSKQLSPEAREGLFRTIRELQAAGMLDFAVAWGALREIDDLNILGATRLAMRRAVEALAERAVDWELPSAYDDPLFELSPDGSRPSDSEVELPLGPLTPEVKLIVDGRPLKPFPYKHEGIIKGDGRSLAIAIASIAAKVSRDREMVRLDGEFPGYGLSIHKGYATKAHREAILELGPLPIHRQLFLRKIIGSSGAPRSN
jgi:ribonuclease HII